MADVNMSEILSNENQDSLDDLANNSAVDVDETQVNDGEEHGEEKTVVRMTQLPLSRVKQIMKQDPDVHLSSQEAVFLITKSTELFLQSIAREAYTHTSIGKRKTMQRKDIDKAIESADSLAFLEGAL